MPRRKISCARFSGYSFLSEARVVDAKRKWTHVEESSGVCSADCTVPPPRRFHRARPTAMVSSNLKLSVIKTKIPNVLASAPLDARGARFYCTVVEARVKLSIAVEKPGKLWASRAFPLKIPSRRET
jgi:hypothetical protein